MYKSIELYTTRMKHFKIELQVVRRVRKIAKSTDRFVLSGWLAVRMEQLGSHWTDFDETLCLSICFIKSVGKIKVSLKSDKNKV